MQFLQINAAADERVLILGRRGENEVLTVRFDVSAWLEEIGNGSVSLYAQRAGDATAYPVVLTRAAGIASWLVTATDTNVRGLGRAELVLTVGGAVKKSAVWQTFVGEDIGQPISDPPEPYESWLEQLSALGDETLINAQRAEGAQAAAEDAQTGAENAQAAAEAAQSAAEDAQTGAENAQVAAEAAQSAAEIAQGKAEDAQAAAEAAAEAAAGGGTAIAPFDSSPSALGNAASPGSSNQYSRGDHVHPMPSASDVGAYTLPAGGIPETDMSSGVQSKLAAGAAALPKAGGTMAGDLSMGSQKISNLADGTAAGDAVNLGQVSSMVSTNTAFFRGNFASKAALLAVSWQTSNPAAADYVTNNDFAIVLDDESQNDECWRYVYVSGTGWQAQYRINETPLTSAQLAALNSGATAALIAQITTNQNAIAGKAAETSVATQGIVSSGSIVFKNSAGTVLFSVALPVYNGGFT